MSAETFAAMETAIAAHIAESLGEPVMMTGVVVVATHERAGADNLGGSYSFEVPERQGTHTTLGLLRLAQVEMEDTWRNNSVSEGED